MRRDAPAEPGRGAKTMQARGKEKRLWISVRLSCASSDRVVQLLQELLERKHRPACPLFSFS